MLARRKTLSHPKGGEVDLPLLIPSFSSKGFRFYQHRKKKQKDNERAGVRQGIYSQTSRALQWTAPFLKESMLISAYDLFHEYFENPTNHLKDTALIVIDSGGYELSAEFDSTEPKYESYQPEPFTLDNYENELRKLGRISPPLPLLIANYDWATKNAPIETQIVEAQKLFNQFPNCMTNIVLKPHTPKSDVLDEKEIIRHIEKLRSFDIVGVTEKELGKNLIDRLRKIARLRRAMSEANIEAPIHIWGGLDPGITPLYFFAGAEIFDGVSWLRYTYQLGLAVNRECYGLLTHHGLETPVDQALLLCMNENLTTLQRLATCLREFVDLGGESFAMFEQNAKIFQTAYRTMKTKINEVK